MESAVMTPAPAPARSAALEAGIARLVGAAAPANAGEPGWLVERRAAARARFAALGLPTTRDEDWRYTDVRPIARTTFEAARPEAALALEPAALAPHLLGDLDALRVVLVDGVFSPRHSALADLPAGVELGSLAAAIERGDDRVAQGLGALAPEATAAFAALNTARFHDGAVVRVAPKVRVERPIHLLHVTTAGAAPIAAHPRALVLLGREASATVIESFVGLGGAPSLTNAVAEVTLDDGAALAHLKLEREGPSAFHVASWTARLGRDARLASLQVSLGGALVRNDIAAVLAGQGGDARLDGLVVAGGARHVDNHTLIDHAVARSTSFESYKHVLAGKARAVFNGRVMVRQDAQKTDAKQENRALLLSPDAVIDTKPQLEIFADDVKCTHGATVGQLDADALFYLAARGLSRRAAERLLTYAFAAELVERLDGEALREPVRALVLGALEGLLGA